MSDSPEDQAVLDFVGAMNGCFGFGQVSDFRPCIARGRACDLFFFTEGVGNLAHGKTRLSLGLWHERDPGSTILWDVSDANYILARCIAGFFYESIQSGKSEFDALSTVSRAVMRFA